MASKLRDRTVKLAPHLAADIEFIKSKQDDRIQRRIDVFKNVLPHSKDEGFRNRVQHFIDIYNNLVREGTGISDLADATFIQGLIRNLDHEMGKYWSGMLKEHRDKLSPDHSARGGVEKLIEILPSVYSHLATEEGLAEKVDEVIRTCEDPSKLYEQINSVLPDKKGFKTVEKIPEGYRKRREKQIRDAPRDFYSKRIKGLDDIFEGQTVIPTGEGKGADPDYQIKERRRENHDK